MIILVTSKKQNGNAHLPNNEKNHLKIKFSFMNLNCDILICILFSVFNLTIMVMKVLYVINAPYFTRMRKDMRNETKVGLLKPLPLPPPKKQ